MFIFISKTISEGGSSLILHDPLSVSLTWSGALLVLTLRQSCALSNTLNLSPRAKLIFKLIKFQTVHTIAFEFEFG